MKKILCFILTVAMINFFIGYPSENVLAKSESLFEIHSINVGNGDATLIRCGSKTMLVDAGFSTIEELSGNSYGNPLSSYLQEHNVIGDDTDLTIFSNKVAELVKANPNNTVTNYLQGLGITSVDEMIATHPHYDHIGGFISVMNRYFGKDTRVWWGAPFETDSYYAAFQTQMIHAQLEKEDRFDESVDPLMSYGVPRAGDYFMFGDGENKARVLFLTSGDPAEDTSIEGINNSTLVIRIDYGETSFLLTGDLQRKGQLKLMQDAPLLLKDLKQRAQTDDNLKDVLHMDDLLNVNYLKIPHHGYVNLGGLSEDSIYSGNHEFFNRIKPEIAVVSTNGRTNDKLYNLPAERTRQDLLDANIYSTAENGNIVVQSDGKHLSTNAVPMEKLYRHTSPQNIKAITQGNEIKITWGHVNYPTQYRVYYQADQNETWNWLKSTKDNQYIFKNPLPNKKYRFVVRTANEYKIGLRFGTPGFSNEVDYQLHAPESFTAKVSGNNIQLSWSPVNYKTRYRLYYQKTDGGPWEYITSTDATSYVYKQGTPKASYRYVIRTANEVNGSNVFSQASFSDRITYPKKAQGFYNLSRRVKIFTAGVPTNWHRYDPYKKKWLGNMSYYNNKPLLLTREYVNEEGTSYYSAYYNGKWIGYVNAAGLKKKVTKDTFFGWGVTEKRVFNTPNPQNYWIYEAHKDKWLGKMTKNGGKTYTIKRSLARADGSLYYSCYIGDKWIGYINSWGFQNR